MPCLVTMLDDHVYRHRQNVFSVGQYLWTIPRPEGSHFADCHPGPGYPMLLYGFYLLSSSLLQITGCLGGPQSKALLRENSAGATCQTPMPV